MKKLTEVMQRLLAPDGCPWDREQTIETLRPFVIEEAYEVVSAMDNVIAGGDPSELKDELGDLLLQIVFQSLLAADKGWFGPSDVEDAIVTKMVRRHEHVFGDVKVSGSEDVLRNWEQIKAREKQSTGQAKGLLSSLPLNMPSLLAGLRMGEKMASVGFDWPKEKGAFENAAGPREKIAEELNELDEALAEKDLKHVEEELGDLLFAVCNFSRRLKLDPEAALRNCLYKVKKRFERMEKLAEQQNLKLQDLSSPEVERLYQEAKATS